MAVLINKHITKSFLKTMTTCLAESSSNQSLNQFATKRMINITSNRYSIEVDDEPSISADRRSIKITNKLEFIEPLNFPKVPMYRILNQDGSLCSSIKSVADLNLTNDRIIELYKGMLKLSAIDRVMFESHRQGRISFYLTNHGEEAVQFGSSEALDNEDWVYAQYREAGILLHRQMPLNLMMAQCIGNKDDLNKGRQMPVHYGNKDLNYVTISSPLATQMPQAAGTAYAFKKDNSNRVVACFFGEGAASEGDAHAALNFASTLSCPVIFVCRNNGYAISTPTTEQYRGDGIVSRGLGYGMCSIRVDGNDLFAVYSAIKTARQICVDESRPVLVEAITYRVGHHSTSDDSSAYRSVHEVREFTERDNPITRVYKYLVSNSLWNEAQENEYKKEVRAEVLKHLNAAEKEKKLSVSSMFEEVYDKTPPHIERQREELISHLKNYGDKYPLNDYEGL